MTDRDPAADARTIAARQIRPHTPGRCGAVLEQICASQPPPCCALPAGHAGWHKDGPTEWTPDGLGVGIGRSEPGESADTGQENGFPRPQAGGTASGVPQDTPNPTQAQGDAVTHTMHNPQAGPPTVLRFRSKSGRTEVARRGDGTISIRVLTGQDRLDLDDAHKLAVVLAE